LPGGPVGPPARWAATSTVEVAQSSQVYPANIIRVQKEGKEGSEGQTQKEKEREGGSGIEEGARDP